MGHFSYGYLMSAVVLPCAEENFCHNPCEGKIFTYFPLFRQGNCSFSSSIHFFVAHIQQENGAKGAKKGRFDRDACTRPFRKHKNRLVRGRMMNFSSFCFNKEGMLLRERVQLLVT